MNHLVAGCGEVGRSLTRALRCAGHDPRCNLIIPEGTQCDILHVCFPFTDRGSFYASTREYQARFQPLFTVIHSTVPVGTSLDLGAHHSPVRGRHPNLEESLTTFVKYVGGPQAVEICDELRKFGIPARSHPHAKEMEAGKLLDLMQFGAAVMLEKEIHRFCEQNGLEFDVVYREFNQTYNDGYRAMGEERFVRPVLQHVDGPIGGHCVVENMKHLDLPAAHRIAEFNSSASVMEVSKNAK